MSIIKEKVEYLKGFCEGAELDPNSKEYKVISKIIEVLDEVALAIDDLEERQDELEDVVDDIDEDLADLEEDYYETLGGDFDDDEDDDDDGFVEIECPHCKETVYFDVAMLEQPTLTCPSCDGIILSDDDMDDFEEDEGEE